MLPSFPLHFPLTDQAECEQHALTILSTIKPDWSDVTFKVFSAGITNKIFSASSGGECVVFRVFGQNTEMFIDRANELSSWSLLSSHSLAAPLHARFHNGLVCGYQTGDTVSVDSVREERMSGKIAARLAQVHSLPCTERPSLFRMCRLYLAAFNPTNYDAAKRGRYDKYFEGIDLARELDDLQATIVSLDSPIAFCHNDLLVYNILYDKETDVINFIDYEYADTNYALFDIANHFCKWAGVEKLDYSLCPDDDRMRQWMRTYLEEKKADNIESTLDKWAVDVYAFKACSFFLWSLWALAQSQHSLKDFDYYFYAELLHKMFRETITIFEQKRAN